MADLSPHDSYVSDLHLSGWIARAEKRQRKRRAREDLDDALMMQTEDDEGLIYAMTTRPHGDDREKAPLKTSFQIRLSRKAGWPDGYDPSAIRDAHQALWTAGSVERTWAEVIKRTFGEGQTQEVTAKDLGVAQSTISERQKAGLAWMREWLDTHAAGGHYCATDKGARYSIQLQSHPSPDEDAS